MSADESSERLRASEPWTVEPVSDTLGPAAILHHSKVPKHFRGERPARFDRTGGLVEEGSQQAGIPHVSLELRR